MPFWTPIKKRISAPIDHLEILSCFLLESLLSLAPLRQQRRFGSFSVHSKFSTMASKSANRHSTYNQSYLTRASIPNTPQLTAYLLRLMAAKQSNLCLSADVQSTSQLLDVAEECGDSICVLKTHADIVHDFGERTIKGLTEIAARKKFLLFEDRKFGDIGNTVQTQYAAGTHRIGHWASLTNAHIFPGPAIIMALKSAAMSALAASNTRISTEITGGPGPVPSFLTDDDQRRSSRPDSDEESSNDDGETTTGLSSPQDFIPRDQDKRKGSVVSISTTISSSAEYISPPAPASPPSTSFTSSADAAAGLPVNAPLARGLLLLAQMSSEDNLLTPTYTHKCVEQARQYRDFVLGFIAQENLNQATDDNFVVMTPGVSLPPRSPKDSSRPSPSRTSSSRSGIRPPKSNHSPTSPSTSTPPTPPELDYSAPSSVAQDIVKHGDSLGQQYNTPRNVILNSGADVIIVGRGIMNAVDRVAESERYRREGWAAYLERTSRELPFRRPNPSANARAPFKAAGPGSKGR